MGAPAELQVDADGRQPEVFGAQPWFTVSLLYKAISNLRGDYGAKAQSCMGGIYDQPAKYSPVMAAVPTASLRHARGNDLAHPGMHNNEESFVEGVSQGMLQAVTSESQIEEFFVCDLIVGTVLPELIVLGQTGHGDDTG